MIPATIGITAKQTTAAGGPFSYIGSVSSVADNSAGAGPTGTLDPSSLGIQLGDLLFVACQYRGGSQTITNSTSGGQTWNALTNDNATNNTTRGFWARFDGTLTTNPIFTVTTGTNPFTAVMHVFRPSLTSKIWAVDTAESIGAISSATPSITGYTPAHNNNVTIACWHVTATNTWGSLTGTNWVVTGLAQYRNTSGSAQGSSYAHQLQTAGAAPTNNVQKTQSANTSGRYHIITFYES